MEKKVKATYKDHKRLHNIWSSMKQRCNNPKDISYKNYGGRGITYDVAWETFQGFFDDMGNLYYEHLAEFGEKDTTLDRVDVDGNYCLDNCKWSTRSEQVKNRRSSRYLDGIPLQDWCDIHGVNYDTIHGRLYDKGWDEESAKNTPIKKLISHEFVPEGVNFSQLCREHNINIGTVQSRLLKGMSLDDALTTPVRQYKKYFGMDTRDIGKLCRDKGISFYTVKRRLEAGYSLEESLNIPVNSIKKPSQFMYKDTPLTLVCEERGLNYWSVVARIKRGWSIEDAVEIPFRKVDQSWRGDSNNE